jgi:predicted nucleic acid-binding protein
MTPTRTFVDSAFFVALAVETDQWHDAAVAWVEQTENGDSSLVTTWAVLLEVGNCLARRQFRSAGSKLIMSILQDPAFTVLPLSESFLRKGLELFSNRHDKEWSLTDCLSFLVMSDKGITGALTSDLHFKQAGFRALLREE